jgi:hypothetical protein
MGLSAETLKAAVMFLVKMFSGSFCESMFMPKNAEAMTSIVTERKSLKYSSILSLKQNLKFFPVVVERTHI